MNHKQVFKHFTNLFPLIAGSSVLTWFPNGKNSIRVRYVNGEDHVFTYNDSLDWSYETVDCFLKKMKHRQTNVLIKT